MAPGLNLVQTLMLLGQAYHLNLDLSPLVMHTPVRPVITAPLVLHCYCIMLQDLAPKVF